MFDGITNLMYNTKLYPKYIHSFVHNLNFSCKDNNFRL